MTTLEAKKIPFKPRRDRTENSWVAMSSTGIKIQAKVEGKSPRGIALNVLKVKAAGAVVTMKGESKFILSLRDVRFDLIEDVTLFGDKISSLFWRNKWDTSWRIVTELATAKRGTFLISSADEQQFELKARAEVAPVIGAADLAAGFSLVSQAAGADQFGGRASVSPVFRAVKWAPVIGTDPAEKVWLASAPKYGGGSKRMKGWQFEEAQLELD